MVSREVRIWNIGITLGIIWGHPLIRSLPTRTKNELISLGRFVPITYGASANDPLSLAWYIKALNPKPQNPKP